MIQASDSREAGSGVRIRFDSGSSPTLHIEKYDVHQCRVNGGWYEEIEPVFDIDVSGLETLPETIVELEDMSIDDVLALPRRDCLTRLDIEGRDVFASKTEVDRFRSIFGKAPGASWRSELAEHNVRAAEGLRKLAAQERWHDEQCDQRVLRGC